MATQKTTLRRKRSIIQQVVDAALQAPGRRIGVEEASLTYHGFTKYTHLFHLGIQPHSVVGFMRDHYGARSRLSLEGFSTGSVSFQAPFVIDFATQQVVFDQARTHPLGGLHAMIDNASYFAVNGSQLRFASGHCMLECDAGDALDEAHAKVYSFLTGINKYHPLPFEKWLR